jgi:hypothetical protein
MVVWFSLIEAPLRPRRVRSAESGGGLGGLHSLGGMTTARAPPGLVCLGPTVKCILHQVNDRCFPSPCDDDPREYSLAAGIPRIWLEINPGNEPSLRVARRAGYRFEQRLPRHCRDWACEDADKDSWHDCFIWTHEWSGELHEPREMPVSDATPVASSVIGCRCTPDKGNFGTH